MNINWEHKSWEAHLPEDYIREHANDLWWVIVCKQSKLSEPFIEEFQDRVYWRIICEYQTLSESFIRKWINKLSLDNVLKYQKVSEEFIREYLFRWKNTGRLHDFCFFFFIALEHQYMSKDFIREIRDWFDCDERCNLFIDSQRDHIDLKFLEEMNMQGQTAAIECLELNVDFIRRWKEQLNWSSICRSHLMSEQTIEEFEDKIDWDEFVLNQGVNDPDRFSDQFWDKYENKILDYQLHHTKDYYAEYELWKRLEKGIKLL